MASLAGQLVGVAFVAALIHTIARRTGFRLRFERAAAMGAVIILGFVGISTLRESWHTLDLQRTANDKLPRAVAVATCHVTGVDPAVLSWLGRRIPPRARFYMPDAPGLVHGAGTCLRFLLMPRLQVAHLASARYVIFWAITPPLLTELRRRGAHVETVRGVTLAERP